MDEHLFDEIKTRKLTFPEIMRMSRDIYGQYYLYIITACVFVFLPLSVLLIFIPAPEALLTNLTAITSGEMTLGSAALTEAFRYSWLTMGAYVLFAPLFTCAAGWITFSAAERKEVSFSGVMDASLLQWGKLILTSILYVIALLLGSVFIFPAVFMGIAFYFYPYLLAVKGSWGWSGIMESYMIVRGRWLRTCGFLLLMYVLTGFTNSIFSYFPLLIASALSRHPVLAGVCTVLLSVVSEILCSFYIIMTSVWLINIIYTIRKFILESGNVDAG